MDALDTAATSEAILALESLAAAAKQRAARLRAAVQADAQAEYRRRGMAPSWRTEATRITLPLSREAVVVVDERRFADHIADTHPGEVVPQVRDAFRGAYLGRCRIVAGDVVDEHGEPVPGVGIRAGGRPGSVTIAAVSDDIKATFAAAGEAALVDLATRNPLIAAALAASDDQADTTKGE